MPTKAVDLFQAYKQNQLPKDGGYIVCSFFLETSAYSRLEVIAYNNLKDLYPANEDLTFQSDGNKLFVLCEPPNYPNRHLEPIARETGHQIPHRFKELDITVCRNQTRIMVSKQPMLTYSSFTILKPTGSNFAFLFYNLPNVLDTMQLFFSKTLTAEARIPKTEAVKAAEMIANGLRKFTIWKD